MAELQLGGKIIATQSGANNPVLASNVVMDNVNVSNALASATFPAGHKIQHKIFPVARYSYDRDSNPYIVRGKFSVTLTAGNLVVMSVYIPETNKGSADSGNYIGVYMFLGTYSPNTTESLTGTEIQTTSILADDNSVALGYGSYNSSTARQHGIVMSSHAIVPTTNLYFASFITRSTAAFTHSIGTNADNFIVIEEFQQ